MLLDTETISQSPDAASSQVPNIMKNYKIITDGKSCVKIKQPHLHKPPFSNKVEKLICFDTPNKITTPNVSFPCKILCPGNILGYKRVQQCAKNESQRISLFNPYADENDENYKFQLSKSFKKDNVPKSRGTFSEKSISINLPKIFGRNTTNLIESYHRETLNLSQNGIQTRRQNSNPNILENEKTFLLEKNDFSSHHMESSAMFRNYDLNDEYWLNFE